MVLLLASDWVWAAPEGSMHRGLFQYTAATLSGGQPVDVYAAPVANPHVSAGTLLFTGLAVNTYGLNEATFPSETGAILVVPQGLTAPVLVQDVVNVTDGDSDDLIFFIAGDIKAGQTYAPRIIKYSEPPAVIGSLCSLRLAHMLPGVAAIHATIDGVAVLKLNESLAFGSVAPPVNVTASYNANLTVYDADTREMIVSGGVFCDNNGRTIVTVQTNSRGCPLLTDLIDGSPDRPRSTLSTITGPGFAKFCKRVLFHMSTDDLGGIDVYVGPVNDPSVANGVCLARDIVFGAHQNSAGYAPPEVGVLIATPSVAPGPILVRGKVQVAPQDDVVFVFLAGRANSRARPPSFIKHSVTRYTPNVAGYPYSCGLSFANMLPEAAFADLSVAGVRKFTRVAYGNVSAFAIQLTPPSGPVIATDSDTGAELAEISSVPCGFYPNVMYMAIVEGHGNLSFVTY